MSYALDLNILLYSVDAACEHHEMAKGLVRQAVVGPETCYLTWEILSGFMRIATHPAIFRNPLSPEAAANNMGTLLESGNIRLLTGSPEAWAIFRRLQKELPIRGNLVPDAWIAAILEANGIRKLYTRDRDYRNFPFLEPMDPF